LQVGAFLPEPLEQHLDRLAFEAPQSAEARERLFGGTAPAALTGGPVIADPETLREIPAPFTDVVTDAERIRFAAFGSGAPVFAARAMKLATDTQLPVTAVVAIDVRTAEASGNTADAMRCYRDAVGKWLPELRAIAKDLPVPFDLIYEEGDAEELIAGAGDARELLVLPTNGWIDHGVTLRQENATRDPDGLLRMIERHPGPVLYAGDTVSNGKVVVIYDGSPAVKRALAFAIDNNLWGVNTLHIVGRLDPVSRMAIDAMIADREITLTHVDRDVDASARPLLTPEDIPEDMADTTAIILPDAPRPLRVNWYGRFWQDCIAEGWRGDVLVWTQ